MGRQRSQLSTCFIGCTAYDPQRLHFSKKFKSLIDEDTYTNLLMVVFQQDYV